MKGMRLFACKDPALNLSKSRVIANKDRGVAPSKKTKDKIVYLKVDEEELRTRASAEELWSFYAPAP